VVAGHEVVLRRRAELADPTGRVKKNAYQAARSLERAAAAELVEAAEQVAAERANAEIAQTMREAKDEGADVRSCAVVVGSSTRAPPLESILRSHALAHAAEGRLYQKALLDGAEACGLETVAVPKQSLSEQRELRKWVDGLRRELGPPWAEDQKLAALAACIALARQAGAALGRYSSIRA
jgi:NTP pyrophosphatase (non-canonical NTP hydrolase)